ncbi:MAG: hypothetical protein M3T96_01345 [Acidobacteriota bacterium]|nr:hypothetical protein [Acidobacteriota bacterium]
MDELSSENLAEFENRFRVTKIFVAAQFLLTIILIVISLFIAPNIENPAAAETARTLWIVIIFIAVGTFLLRRMFLRWDRLRDIALLKGVRGLLRTLQSNAIILAVLAETIVVIGLVIARLSGERFDRLRAGIVALILLVINFSRRQVWGKIAASLQEI